MQPGSEPVARARDAQAELRHDAERADARARGAQRLVVVAARAVVAAAARRDDALGARRVDEAHADDGEGHASLLARRDARLLIALPRRIPELADRVVPATPEVWECLQGMHTVCTVNGAIPTQMLSQIELVASKLAGDIASGKADLGSMDLGAIGQEVLSHCNEQDMTAFAENLGQLMPVLQQSATVAAASGGHAVAGGGEHARKNQFNYLVLREKPRKFSSMYAG